MATKFKNRPHEGTGEREFVVEINVTQIRRVRTALGLDLMQAFKGELLEKLYDDPETLCNVLFVLCRDQCGADGATDEERSDEFGRGMGGDAIDRGRAALLEELVSFYQSPTQRESLSRAIKKMDASLEKVRQAMKEKLDSPEMDRAMDQAVQTAVRQISLGSSGAPSGSAPESLQ